MSNTRKVRKLSHGSESDRFDLDNYEPIVLKTRNEDEEIEMLHVFTIDDKKYYMPTRVPFNVTIKAMRIYAEKGEAAALDYQLRVLLGTDGYDALMDFDDLESEDFQNIVNLADQIVTASAKGKAA